MHLSNVSPARTPEGAARQKAHAQEDESVVRGMTGDRPLEPRVTPGFESTGRIVHEGASARARRAANKAIGLVPLASAGDAVARVGLGLRPVTLIYDPGPHTVSNLRVNGSWDRQTGKPTGDWGPWDIPMQPLGDGRWAATVELYDDGRLPRFEWGVRGDTPKGKDQWLVTQEENPSFELGPTRTVATYAPTTLHVYGAHRRQNDLHFAYWAPNARSVALRVIDEPSQSFAMTRDEVGNWSARLEGLADKLAGRPYVYDVVTSDGRQVARTDPYAREVQGEQRGLSRMYVDPTTGKEATYFSETRLPLMRFEVNEGEKYERVELVLRHPDGKLVTAKELALRLGPFDPTVIEKMRGGAFNDHWSQHVRDDGHINLLPRDGAFSVLIDNPDALAGLTYELRGFVRGSDGTLTLRGDINGDGVLQGDELAHSLINDPWSNLLTAQSGKTFRASLIPKTPYVRRFDDAPREKDPTKWVIYQLHVGSFLGSDQNMRRSTFKDVIAKLDYIKELGANTIELLPTGEFEGIRNWGYYGSNVFAAESAYGFEHEGRWVGGFEALQIFIDEAHRRGLNVVNDVIYNHVWGETDPLAEHDGPQDAYYNWSREPAGVQRQVTPWGNMPAFNRAEVRRFFVDHAVAQVVESGFDGLRFDFTGIITEWGGTFGRQLLRDINRQLRTFSPDAFTVAEHFDYDPDVTRPIQKDGRGLGFSAQWYTEIQHRVVFDHHDPSVLQQAVAGERMNIDRLMNTLTHPRGLDSWRHALYVISNHDEVGNAHRIIDIADGPTDPELPPQWARNVVRLVTGMGLMAPGIPIMFQGDEFMARNGFRWGITTTWGMDWSWEDLGRDWRWDEITFNDERRALYEELWRLPKDEWPSHAGYQRLSAADRKVAHDLGEMPPSNRDRAMLQLSQRLNRTFVSEAMRLRGTSEALQAGGEVHRVYTQNEQGAFAFSRVSGGEAYLVVGSFNQHRLDDVNIPVPPGRWELVLNSDSPRFGGQGIGDDTQPLNGDGTSGGGTSLTLPPGGLLVFRRVAS